MSKTRVNPRQDSIIAEAYESLYAPVLRYISRHLGDATMQEAEDICQDTFLQLLEYDRQLEPESISRLVYTIARNQVVDYLRHHCRTRAAQEYFSLHAPKSVMATDEQVAVNELTHREQQYVSTMPERKAQVYILYIHYGRSIDEVASTMQISPRTVENQIFRARAQFRSILSSN